MTLKKLSDTVLIFVLVFVNTLLFCEGVVGRPEEGSKPVTDRPPRF